jgi:hypothetical protein
MAKMTQEQRTALNQKITDEAAVAIAAGGIGSLSWRTLHELTTAHRGRKWLVFALPGGETVHMPRLTLRRACAEVRRSARMKEGLTVSIGPSGLVMRWRTGALTLRCLDAIPKEEKTMTTVVVFPEAKREAA